MPVCVHVAVVGGGGSEGVVAGSWRGRLSLRCGCSRRVMFAAGRCHPLRLLASPQRLYYCDASQVVPTRKVRKAGGRKAAGAAGAKGGAAAAEEGELLQRLQHEYVTIVQIHRHVHTWWGVVPKRCNRRQPAFGLVAVSDTADLCNCS